MYFNNLNFENFNFFYIILLRLKYINIILHLNSKHIKLLLEKKWVLIKINLKYIIYIYI